MNNINIQGNMEKESTKKMTREDALRRLEEARKLKREYVKELEKKMKEGFKKRTGQDATLCARSSLPFGMGKKRDCSAQNTLYKAVLSSAR